MKCTQRCCILADIKVVSPWIKSVTFQFNQSKAQSSLIIWYETDSQKIEWISQIKYYSHKFHKSNSNHFMCRYPSRNSKTCRKACSSPKHAWLAKPAKTGLMKKEDMKFWKILLLAEWCTMSTSAEANNLIQELW